MSFYVIVMEVVVLVETELLYKSKLILNSGLVEEIEFWKVPKNEHFPEGIKYRLLLIDPVWKKVLLLLDNELAEYDYRFSSIESLIGYFFELRTIAEKNYENNEN